MEVEKAFVLDVADNIGGGIFDLRKSGWKSAGTRMETAGRNGHAQSFMGTFEIVDVAVSIELTLSVEVVVEGSAAEEFELESSMEALFLALSLWMKRPAMRNSDTQTHKPDGEFCIGRIGIVAPRRAVVHEHAQRQAVELED